MSRRADGGGDPAPRHAAAITPCVSVSRGNRSHAPLLPFHFIIRSWWRPGVPQFRSTWSGLLDEPVGFIKANNCPLPGGSVTVERPHLRADGQGPTRRLLHSSFPACSHRNRQFLHRTLRRPEYVFMLYLPSV